MKKTIAFAKEISKVWTVERPTQMAAAMAYYGMFSFVPIIYIAFLIVEYVGSRLSLPGLDLEQLMSFLDPEVVELLTDALSTISEPNSSGTIIGVIIGFGALLFAASGLFFQLQLALNTIWQVPPSVRGSAKFYILQRLVSLFLVICIGLLLILVLFVNIVLTWFQSLLQFFWENAGNFSLLNYLVSIAILFFTLLLVYKFIPNRKIAWRDVFIGSGVATTIMVVAGFVMRLLLNTGGFSTGFKAAGSLALILIGIYYIAQILLFGAVVSRVAEKNLSSEPEPINP